MTPRRAEAAEAALSRADGAGRLVRRHPHQPIPPGVDRDARAAGSERVAVGQLRSRAPRPRERRLGLRRHQSRRPGVGSRGGRPGGRHRPRQRGVDVAQGRARQRRQGGHDLGQPDQARSVRGSARGEDRVPDEAERDGAGARRQLRELAAALRRRTEILRLERGIANYAAAGADLSAVHDDRVRPRHGRLPDARRRRSRAADRLRVSRGLSLARRTPKRPVTRWSRS